MLISFFETKFLKNQNKFIFVDMKEKLLKILKTKASQFGFSKTELESIADDMSNNPKLTDEMSDEVLNEIIDYVLPSMKAGQQMATRLQKTTTKTEEPKDDKKGNSDEVTKKSDDESTPQWAKDLIDDNRKLLERVASLESEKTSDTRKRQLEKKLADTGSYGKSILKAFEKMSFKDDDDFTDYLNDVDEQVKEFKQSVGDDALKTMGTKPNGGGKNPKQATEKEIDDIVAHM